MMKKIKADPNALNYMDEAMGVPSIDSTGMTDFVQTHAAQIPKTHGAPEQRHAAVN